MTFLAVAPDFRLAHPLDLMILKLLVHSGELEVVRASVQAFAASCCALASRFVIA